MGNGIQVRKIFSVFLSLLLVMSFLTPTVQAVSPDSEQVEEVVIQQQSVDKLLTNTVNFYKESNKKLDSWQTLVGLYAAGEDLTNGEWNLPDWRSVDPGDLKSTNGGTEHIRYIFGLLAMNENPADAWETHRNLYSELAKQQNDDTGAIGGINKHMWALLAMDTGERLGVDLGKWGQENKQKALDYLISQQNKDGGYSFFGPVSDPDMTGMGMIALSNYQGIEAADAAIEKTKKLLRERQLDLTNGGFNSPGNFGSGDNANSTATAIWGLAAVKENILGKEWQVEGKTVLDALKGFRSEDGSYKWKANDKNTNLMATEQVLLALADIKAGNSVWNRISTKTIKHKANVKIDGLSEAIISDTEVIFEPGSTILQVVGQFLTKQDITYEIDDLKKNFLSINGVRQGLLGGNDRWYIDVNKDFSTSYVDNIVNENDKIHIFYKRNAALESSSDLEVGEIDPTIKIILTGDTFTDAAAEASNWTIGSASLTVNSVTIESNQKVLLNLTGEVPDTMLQITGLANVLQTNVNRSAYVIPVKPVVARTVEDMLADTLRFYEVERYNVANFRFGMPELSWTEVVALNACSSQLTNGIAKVPDWITKDPGIQENEPDTEHIRYIFGLLAAGKDPSNAWETKRNLYAELAAQQKEDGSIGAINKHAWAMLALETGEKRAQDVGTWNTEAKEKALEHLLKQEKNKGGFALSLNVNDSANPDMTGMVLLALANHQDASAVDSVIERAKGLLREQQLDTAGWGSWGTENSNSIATVISGLIAVGEDVTSAKWQKDEKTPLDALSKFQMENGAFAYKLPVEKWINTQAVEQSLIALLEIKTGKSVWQQFYEVDNSEPPVESIDKAQLILAIETAEEKLATTQEGTAAGQYQKESRELLRQAIDIAKAVKANTQIDQQEVNAAISVLRKAVTQYENSQVKPEVTPPVTTPVAKNITFSVEKRTFGTGDIITPRKIEIQSGDTAFTVLKREVESQSISLEYSGVGPTIYVKSINGIGEFTGGPLSGWMYSVNGEFPQYSAGIYDLKEGDILRWQYTTNLGADLGDNWNPNPPSVPTPTPKPEPKPDPKPPVKAPENVEATVTDGKLQIQVKDEKTGKLEPAKVEKTEVVGGFVIVQIGEAGKALDGLEGLDLPPGEPKVVVLDNDEPYNYFKSESKIESTKEWEIKFSGALQRDPENLKKVIVRNAAGEIVEAALSFGEEGKSLKIKPADGYTKGELYYLTIAEVKSANGKVIKEPIRKIFVVE